MISPSENVSNVRDYYDKSTRWYRWFYYDRESLGLHYGFWNVDTKSRQEALLNQYRTIRDLISPKPEDRILDAGCGVGGALFWLAKEAPAHYTGITISEIQLAMARRYAKKRDPKGKIDFLLRNFFDAKFKSGSFDKIFAIESFCYAYPHPEKLYAEMFRTLASSGKMVISDGFLLRQPENEAESLLTAEVLKGFKMVGWNTPSEIMAALKNTGFENVRCFDKSKEVENSVADIVKRSKMASPFRIFRHVGLVSKTEEENLLATYGQKRMYDAGLFGYRIFVAEKPRNA